MQLKVYSSGCDVKIDQLQEYSDRYRKGMTGDGSYDENELFVLIRDCIAESRPAQKRLYDMFAPKAYGIVRRYIYDDLPAAEEVLNDSFYKVLTKLSQYSFQGSFEGWIRRIVINTITDHLRKNIRDTYVKEVQPEDAFVQSEPVGNIAYKELLQLVQTLPEGQRTVFNLFVAENYAHKEIAALLGITESNSRWYLNDARKRLREKIKFHQ
jgi:RNA polymerase sigma factor (sigma-70 family)